MSKRLLSLVGVIAVSAVLATACTSKTSTTVLPAGQNQTGIAVSATGKASGSPDVVVLQLGVQSEAKTVAAAREAAAGSLSSTIASVKANGVDDKDIRTIQFRVDPQYDYANNRQTLRGYRVTNVLQVKVRKVDDASKVIDDAITAGGNDIIVRSISFAIDDPTKLQEQARADAMKQAKAQADQLARLGNVTLGDPISISETASRQPVTAMIAAAPAAAGAQTSTPIEAGEMDIQVTVNVVYSIH